MAELLLLEESQDKKLNKQDERLASFILEHSAEEYEELLRDADWDTFYQMSSLRESILNWYPFMENSTILQLSDGFGAITGLLTRVAKKVVVLEKNERKALCIAKRWENAENLTILTTCNTDILSRDSFDYIIAEKVMDTSYAMNQMIEKVWPFLKETGRLLFVCENRFGMKYWCGVPDPLMGQPFAGIRGRSQDGMLNRQELIDQLERNEKVKGWKLYYPFPDHRFAQAVYTDEYLPKESVRDRVIPYYPEKERESLVCLENEISDSLIANGVFHVFSNSFLVECAKKETAAQVKFAALSTDRGKEHGFATIIMADQSVQKKILHPDGRKSLELLHQNQQELLEHGVCCVDEQLKMDALEMPYVEGRSLIEHLKYLFLHQPEQVEAVMDLLYTEVLKSSEQVSFSECKLKDDRLNEENAGGILKKAYIDMIPYNSFYRDGKILFYDQEFVRECFPAKYVLFRALRYTYIYISEAQQIIPVSYFQKKYGLYDVWQIFEAEEARFVEQNRNYELLSSFYRWSAVDTAYVDHNIERLKKTAKEKTAHIEYLPFVRHRYDVEKYKKNIALNAIKNVQLELLKRFIEVCEEYDLSYCVFYGTLLGTIRHKGFVPWDDDVDVLMPRIDYDRLLQVSEEAFDKPYFLQTPEKDPECFYGGYSKLRNGNTTGLETRNEGKKCNQGIWIDIMPLDRIPEDEEEREKQQKEILFYQRLLWKKTYPDQRVLWEMDWQKEAYFEEISRVFEREELCQRLHDAMVKEVKEAASEETAKVAVLARYWREKSCPQYCKKDFEFLIKRKFETLDVYVPVGYEACLEQEYGKDYAVYPCEADRKPHHQAHFDVTKSYVDYIGKTEYNDLGN